MQTMERDKNKGDDTKEGKRRKKNAPLASKRCTMHRTMVVQRYELTTLNSRDLETVQRDFPSCITRYYDSSVPRLRSCCFSLSPARKAITDDRFFFAPDKIKNIHSRGSTGCLTMLQRRITFLQGCTFHSKKIRRFFSKNRRKQPEGLEKERWPLSRGRETRGFFQRPRWGGRTDIVPGSRSSHKVAGLTFKSSPDRDGGQEAGVR